MIVSFGSGEVLLWVFKEMFLFIYFWGGVSVAFSEFVSVFGVFSCFCFFVFDFRGVEIEVSEFSYFTV